MRVLYEAERSVGEPGESRKVYVELYLDDSGAARLRIDHVDAVDLPADAIPFLRFALEAAAWRAWAHGDESLLIALRR